VSLYYEATGLGQALVFVNGLGMSTRDWKYQVDYFSKSFRVVTFDPRGHGRSDKPKGPYSIPLFASDTAQLIRSLDLPPVHIVGLSMGGMIAFELAARVPQLLKSMVIVNSAPEFIIRTARQKFEFTRRKFIIRFLGMRKMGEFLAGRLFPKPSQSQMRETMAQRWAENDRRAYLDSLLALKGWSVQEHLGSIKCPTLVVASDQDYTPVNYKEWYVRKMPDAKLAVIEDSRHVAPMDQPDRFNELLSDFLIRFA
jgi:pimeloyl-ACP methyl ester carboxylesterase